MSLREIVCFGDVCCWFTFWACKQIWRIVYYSAAEVPIRRSFLSFWVKIHTVRIGVKDVHAPLTSRGLLIISSDQSFVDSLFISAVVNELPKLNNKELPLYDAFQDNLQNCNPHEKEYLDYEKLMCSNMTTEAALVKMTRSEISPKGAVNYSYLQKVWEQENFQAIKDLSRRNINKEVVPTFEAMQKKVKFYHNKGIDMLKVGCTLHNLTNICLQSSTSVMFYHFTDSEKDLPSKVRKDMIGGSLIVFTDKAVVDESHIRKSTNAC